MPTRIERDELQALTRRGAQLVEVLPADEYDWAHPGEGGQPLDFEVRCNVYAWAL